MPAYPEPRPFFHPSPCSAIVAPSGSGPTCLSGPAPCACREEAGRGAGPQPSRDQRMRRMQGGGRWVA